MIRKSLAFAGFALLLSMQVEAVTAALAEESVVLTDRTPSGELVFWNKIKASGNVADFATYLQNFPNGMFYDPALEKFQALGGNPSDLHSQSVAVPAEKSADVKSVIPAQKVIKTTSKKVYKKSTRRVATRRIAKPVCPVTKHLVGNSCQIVVRKIKVVKSRPIRIAKTLPKKKFDPNVRRDGAGGDGSGGGGGGGSSGGGWN